MHPPARTLAVAAWLALGWLLGPSAAHAQKAVYLVRHAEKAGDQANSPLTKDGTRRARALAKILAAAEVKAIYASDARRTRDTAAPLAAALGVTPVVVAAGDPATTFARIRTDHPNDVVLVVGHSNTVPELIKKWAPSSSFTITDGTFDNIFVVVPTGPAQASVVRLRYTPDGP